jgi:hypothetical protein
MKLHKFDELVQAEAQRRVSAKIKAFRKEVIEAANKLLGLSNSSGLCYTEHVPYAFHPKRDSSCQQRRTLLEQLLKENPIKGWPTKLWEDERATVAKELNAQLDIVQQMMLEAQRTPDADEPTPEEPVDETKAV